jgi:hypothetical protein
MKYFIRTGFVFLCFVLFCMQARPQSLLVTAGIGFIDLTHAGVKLEIKQFQAGFTVGNALIDKKVVYTSSLDLYYHFAGKSKEVKVKPWYIRAGMNYYKNETLLSRNDIWFMKARLGREFNLSKRIGFFAEGGAVILVIHTYKDKDPNDDTENRIDFTPYQPSMAAGMFYRF